MKLLLWRLFSAWLFMLALCGTIFISGANAAELVMFEQPGCVWCARFNREIAPIYPKTPEGQRAPLRRVDITQSLPADLAFINVERLTPLFVMTHNGKELGRIRGYPGEDHFWGLLGALIARLDSPGTSAEQTEIFPASPLRAPVR